MSVANEAYSNLPVDEFTAISAAAHSVAPGVTGPCASELPHLAKSYTLVATTSFDSVDSGAAAGVPSQIAQQPLLQPHASITSQGDVPNRDWNAEHQSLLEWCVSHE